MQLMVEQLSLEDLNPSLRSEWEQLVERSTRPSIYASFDYVQTSIKHFSQQSDNIFFILVRTSEGALAAIFPLNIYPRVSYQKKIRVLGHCVDTDNSEMDKPYPIIDRRFERECWQIFAEQVQGPAFDWDLIEYDELIPESAMVKGAEKWFCLPKFYTRVKPGPVSPIVDLSSDWQAFSSKHRNLRRKIRRMQRVLGKGFRFEVLTGDAAKKKGIDIYVAAEKASWKAGKGVSESETEAFYRDLVAQLADKRQVVFTVLWQEHEVVAAEMSYIYLDNVYFALGTYAEKYRHLSPGSVCTSLSIQYFCGQGYNQGDFLAGFAHYIDPWAEEKLHTYNLAIFRVNRRFAYHVYKTFFFRLKRKLNHWKNKLRQKEFA